MTAVLPPQHVGPVPGELATVVMPTRPGVHRSTRVALLIVAATVLIFIVGLARRSARRPADTPPSRTEQERW
ncbi:hypothetical protein ACLQ25_06815 [Micromonospora sp. DT44]|uniref:hypothetical protein n=1 Tax=Micromonospora sp. DT44 TaxID=3393439 RepID=UPI003CED9F3B